MASDFYSPRAWVYKLSSQASKSSPLWFSHLFHYFLSALEENAINLQWNLICEIRNFFYSLNHVVEHEEEGGGLSNIYYSTVAGHYEHTKSPREI